MLSKEALEELEMLRKRNRKKMLVPKEIVEFAKDESTALHKQIYRESDSEAAYQHRLQLAERVIRLAVTVVKNPDAGPMKIRLYCSLPSDRVNGGGYRSVYNVLRSNKQRSELIQSALSELAAFQKKYQGLEALDPVMVEIDRVLNHPPQAVAS